MDLTAARRNLLNRPPRRLASNAEEDGHESASQASNLHTSVTDSADRSNEEDLEERDEEPNEVTQDNVEIRELDVELVYWNEYKLENHN